VPRSSSNLLLYGGVSAAAGASVNPEPTDADQVGQGPKSTRHLQVPEDGVHLGSSTLSQFSYIQSVVCCRPYGHFKASQLVLKTRVSQYSVFRIVDVFPVSQTSTNSVFAFLSFCVQYY